MFSYYLSWKNFNVNIGLVDAYVNSLSFGSSYKGNSADTQLTLWFDQELTDEQKTEIQDYWDALTEESAEALNYVSQAQITARIDELKTDMLSKSWDELSLAQRKIILNQPLSNTELGF